MSALKSTSVGFAEGGVRATARNILAALEEIQGMGLGGGKPMFQTVRKNMVDPNIKMIHLSYSLGIKSPRLTSLYIIRLSSSEYVYQSHYQS